MGDPESSVVLDTSSHGDNNYPNPVPDAALLVVVVCLKCVLHLTTVGQGV